MFLLKALIETLNVYFMNKSSNLKIMIVTKIISLLLDLPSGNLPDDDFVNSTNENLLNDYVIKTAVFQGQVIIIFVHILASNCHVLKKTNKPRVIRINYDLLYRVPMRQSSQTFFGGKTDF